MIAHHDNRNDRDLATRRSGVPRWEKIVGIITAALLFIAAALEVYARWPR